MTLLVIALDGLDAGLVEQFDINEFQLSTYGEVETFKYAERGPYTLEIWPTVATGLHPREHGITGSNISDWNNPLIEAASKVTAQFPGPVRTRLGKIARKVPSTDYAIPETNAQTVFDGDGRVVQNWPGVANGSELREVWEMTNQGYSQETFEREVLGKAAGQFGWAKEMLSHNVSLAGVHVHALDVFGHAYSEQVEDMERTYQRVADHVSGLADAIGDDDDLLVISDHGMQTSWLDSDGTPGHHSYRAFASTTLGTIPETMFEARDWIEDHVSRIQVDREELEMPKEQLRELGYIE